MSTAAAPRSRRRRTLGPADHGRRMSFPEFVRCDFQEGWSFELARGLVVVTDIPSFDHCRTVGRLATLFEVYNLHHPGHILYRAGGQECRVRAPGMRSDRHPDQAVYLDPEPPITDSSIWTVWVPSLVVEVVSRGSVRRDYVEKAEEYLRIGVREYWILDAGRRQMLVHRRVGDTWEKQPIAAGKAYRTPLLPGLVVRPGELLGPGGGRGH